MLSLYVFYKIFDREDDKISAMVFAESEEQAEALLEESLLFSPKELADFKKNDYDRYEVNQPSVIYW